MFVRIDQIETMIEQLKRQLTVSQMTRQLAQLRSTQRTICFALDTHRRRLALCYTLDKFQTLIFIVSFRTRHGTTRPGAVVAPLCRTDGIVCLVGSH